MHTRHRRGRCTYPLGAPVIRCLQAAGQARAGRMKLIALSNNTQGTTEGFCKEVKAPCTEFLREIFQKMAFYLLKSSSRYEKKQEK